jgi:hypothetical protein
MALTRRPTAELPLHQSGKPLGRYHQPSARECALLILHLLQARQDEVGKEVSRVRISQTTLRILCGRNQIGSDFLLDVQEFLLAAGWCLFCVGPTHFGIIKRKAVEGWARISSGRISGELNDVARGEYDFELLEPLLMPSEARETDGGED